MLISPLYDLKTRSWQGEDSKLNEAKSLMPAVVSWKDIGRIISHSPESFCCFLTLGNDNGSKTIFRLLQENWLRYDRESGAHVVLIVPTAIPGDVVRMLPENHPFWLPDGLRSRNAELFWQTFFSRQSSFQEFAVEWHRELSAVLGESLPTPALVVVESKASQDPEELLGWVINLQMPTTDESLSRLMRWLNSAAEMAHLKKTGESTAKIFRDIVSDDWLQGTQVRIRLSSFLALLEKALSIRDRIRRFAE